MKTIKTFPIFGLIVSFLLMSCEADIKLNRISNNIQIDPSLVVPLGGVSLNLGDIISANDSNKIFSDKYSELTYERIDSMLFTYPLPDLVANAKSYSRSIYLSPISTITVPSNTTLPSVSINQDFDMGVNDVVSKEQVDSIIVSNAVLTIIVRSNGLALDLSKVKLKFSFENGKMRMLDNKPSVFDFQPTAFDRPIEVRIRDFVIITSGKANSIPLSITLNATTSGQLQLNPMSKVDLDFKFTTIDWKAIYGKFDLSTLSDFVTSTNRIPVNFKKYLPHGEVKFSNPQINIAAISNVGMRLGFKLDYFKGYVDSDTVYANFNGKRSLEQLFNERPSKPGDSVNLTFRTFDSNYGQTDKLIEKRPETYEYKITAYSNSVTDNLPNFIIPDSRIKVKIKTTIPMQLNAGSMYEHKDTMINVFGDLVRQLKQTLLEKVEIASLVFTFNNKLPVKSMMDIRFLDNEGNEVVLSPTFKKTYEVLAAKVDADGKVMQSNSIQQLVVSLNNDELNRLKSANSLEYKITVAGGDLNSKIFFSKTNTFDMKLGFFLKTKL